nr:unnamed protein product [Rangifer tarandus platyrhynchus]
MGGNPRGGPGSGARPLGAREGKAGPRPPAPTSQERWRASPGESLTQAVFPDPFQDKDNDDGEFGEMMSTQQARGANPRASGVTPVSAQQPLPPDGQLGFPQQRLVKGSEPTLSSFLCARTMSPPSACRHLGSVALTQ